MARGRSRRRSSFDHRRAAEDQRFPDGLSDVTVCIYPQARTVLLQQFPHDHTRSYYEHGRVWTEDNDGQLIGDLRDPVSSFEGHTRTTPWSPLQLAHFLGYSLWNYFTMPFLLADPSVKVDQGANHSESGQTWKTLDVTFTGGLDTHCREQRFYFDEGGRLRRNDYVTDLAKGTVAHYTSEHTRCDGIWIPMRRRVVSRAEDGSVDLAGMSNVLMEVSSALHFPVASPMMRRTAEPREQHV